MYLNKIMKLKLVILVAIILSLAAGSFAQSAKPAPVPKRLPPVTEILDAYVKAIGGREAQEKIKSRSLKGTVEMVPMGIKGTFESIVAAPDRSFTRMNMAGLGEFLDGFDGKTAWSINPIQGSREKSAAEVAQQKLINDFYREIKLDKVYKNLTVTGIEKVGAAETYVVRAEAGGLAAPDIMYFDTKTGLLLRMDSIIIAPEGNQPVKIFYEDLRPIDGVTIPMRIRSQLPAFEITMTATELKHDVPFKPEIFAKPAK